MNSGVGTGLVSLPICSLLFETICTSQQNEWHGGSLNKLVEKVAQIS